MRPGICTCSTSRRWPRSTVENTSLHPPDYATRLSASDIANLVAYLSTLRGRDAAKTAPRRRLPGGVTYERLLNAKAEPHNWLMYWGDYQGTHYSPLSGITTGERRARCVRHGRRRCRAIT